MKDAAVIVAQLYACRNAGGETVEMFLSNLAAFFTAWMPTQSVVQ